NAGGLLVKHLAEPRRSVLPECLAISHSAISHVADLLGSPFSLAEGRILYELAHRAAPTAADLARELDLDAGYLSRLLRGFSRQGLLTRRQSSSDGRQSHLALTLRGRRAAARLDRGSQQVVGAMLRRLSAADQGRLVSAVETIQDMLGGRMTPTTRVP